MSFFFFMCMVYDKIQNVKIMFSRLVEFVQLMPKCKGFKVHWPLDQCAPPEQRTATINKLNMKLLFYFQILNSMYNLSMKINLQTRLWQCSQEFCHYGHFCIKWWKPCDWWCLKRLHWHFRKYFIELKVSETFAAILGSLVE